MNAELADWSAQGRRVRVRTTLRLRLRWSRLPSLLRRRRSQHLLLLRMTHRRWLRLILPALLALRLSLLLRSGALLLL